MVRSLVLFAVTVTLSKMFNSSLSFSSFLLIINLYIDLDRGLWDLSWESFGQQGDRLNREKLKFALLSLAPGNKLATEGRFLGAQHLFQKLGSITMSQKFSETLTPSGIVKLFPLESCPSLKSPSSKMIPSFFYCQRKICSWDPVTTVTYESWFESWW